MHIHSFSWVILLIMLQESCPALGFACQEGINARTFEEAAREGEDIIGKVGSSLLEDCASHEKVIKKLEKSIEKALKTKDRDLCKKAGLAFGIFRKFKNMNQLCSRGCLYNGRLIGVLGAQFFCDMALGLGSWDDPTDLTVNLQNSCDVQFGGNCRAYFNQEAGLFTDAVSGQSCAPLLNDPNFIKSRDRFCSLSGSE